MNLLELVFWFLVSCSVVLLVSKLLFDFVAYCKFMEHYRILNDRGYFADDEEGLSDDK